MSRGRPSEQTEIRRKYELTFHEVPTKPELGETSIWYFDLDKAPNGPYKVEVKHPRDLNHLKLKLKRVESIIIYQLC